MSGIDIEDGDGMLSLLRDSVAAFAMQFDGPTALRNRRASRGDLDQKMWQHFVTAGWPSLLLSEELGGAGLGLREQVILSEAIGRALLTEPLAQLGVFSSVFLSACETSDEVARLAAGLVDGSATVSQAWQNQTGKTQPLAAKYQGDTIVVNGKAAHVVAASTATDFLVLAQAAQGIVVLSLPATATGLSYTQRPTVDGSMLGTLDLENCTVPTSNILCSGDVAQAALTKAIQATRLAIAAELCGVGSCALEKTVEFTKGRVQFGKPIASFQAIQHRLVDMWSEAEFANAAQANAIEEMQDNPGKPTTLAILAAKARAGDAAVNITRRAVHLHGAMGFTDECDIGLYMKRAINLNATLGQSEELRLEFVALERAS